MDFFNVLFKMMSHLEPMSQTEPSPMGQKDKSTQKFGRRKNERTN